MKPNDGVETITKYLDEIKRLDREATKGWYEDCDMVRKKEDGCVGNVATFWACPGDVKLTAHYRTSAPRLAEVMEKAVKTLNFIGSWPDSSPASLAIEAKATLHQIAAILSNDKTGGG